MSLLDVWEICIQIQLKKHIIHQYIQTVYNMEISSIHIT